jgi:hypothetical protein
MQPRRHNKQSAAESCFLASDQRSLLSYAGINTFNVFQADLYCTMDTRHKERSKIKLLSVFLASQYGSAFLLPIAKAAHVNADVIVSQQGEFVRGVDSALPHQAVQAEGGRRLVGLGKTVFKSKVGGGQVEGRPDLGN